MRLFVSNIPYEATQAELSDFFLRRGYVADGVTLSTEPNGKSRGFGFVRFRDEEAAKHAAGHLNGRELLGRRIAVKVSARGNGKGRGRS